MAAGHYHSAHAYFLAQKWNPADCGSGAAVMSALSDVIIRPAQPADVQALAALARVTFYEAYDTLTRPSDLDAYTAEHYSLTQIARELADPRLAIWLGLHGEEAVGFLQLAVVAPPSEVKGRRPLKLDRLYLRKSAWGLGLGRRFMELMLRTAAERGHDSVWLSVWEKNPRALRFYQNWGFIDIGWEIFPTGEDRSIDRLMERLLSAAPPDTAAQVR